MRFHLICLTYAIVVASLISNASAAYAQAQEILWSALRPAVQQTASDRSSGVARSGSDSQTLAWNHEDTVVKLTGFVVPIDSDGDLVYEFLLVPLAGACSHTAPPPANQVVHVFPQKPFRISKAYEFVSIVGALHPGLDKSQLFIMDGVKVIEFGYSMRQAQVTTETQRRDPDLKGVSPWSFL
jgi:hypothetical protein